MRLGAMVRLQSAWRQIMLDLVFLGAGAALFLAMALYARALTRL